MKCLSDGIGFRARSMVVIVLPVVLLMGVAVPSRAGQEPMQLKGPLEPLSVEPLTAVDVADEIEAYNLKRIRLESLSGRVFLNYQQFILMTESLARVKSIGSSRAPVGGTGACLPVSLDETYRQARAVWGRYHQQALQARAIHRRLELYLNNGYGEGLPRNQARALDEAVKSFIQIRVEHRNLLSLLLFQMDVIVRRMGCPVPDLVFGVEGADSRPLGVASGASTVGVGATADAGNQRLGAALNTGSAELAVGVEKNAGTGWVSPAITFTVDNSRCEQVVEIYLDGVALATVPGYARLPLKASEGVHILGMTQFHPLTPEEETSTVIEVLMYKGFFIQPRC